jgi:hypothetical protein
MGSSLLGNKTSTLCPEICTSSPQMTAMLAPEYCSQALIRRLCMKINLKKISKKWWIIGGVVLLLLIVVVFVRSRSTASTSTATLQTVKAEVGTLSQTIGATGTVEASQSADLVWGTSGNIASVNAKIGDMVSPNQVLATGCRRCAKEIRQLELSARVGCGDPKYRSPDSVGAKAIGQGIR